jgi:hypothetical protein
LIIGRSGVDGSREPPSRLASFCSHPRLASSSERNYAVSQEAERPERENARTLKVFAPLADSADLE